MSPALTDSPELNALLAQAGAAPRWLVALSGGVDSVALLSLLCRWRDGHPGCPPLQAVHIHHGMQPGADSWERHCRALCAALDVALDCVRVAVEPAGAGMEAAAREARYQVFERCLGEGEILFMGHHLDDQVETFFLRLLRGAGVEGLAAMPARRALGAGELLRPLLRVPRGEIERYAADVGLAWIEDPSNRDTALDRNFLRLEVLPLLESRWPGYRSTVARAAGNLRAGQRPAPTACESAMGDPGVPLGELSLSDPTLLMLELRAWLRALGLPMPDRAPLAEFARQLGAGAGIVAGRQQLRWGGQVVQRFGGALFLLPQPLSFEAPRQLPQLSPGAPVRVPGLGEFSLEPAGESGLALQSGEALRLAWRRGGERCQPVDRERGSSLKKVLQERAIPPWWRDRMPLFYRGDELVAVGDLWLCRCSRYRAAGEAPGPLWRVAWQR